ncbi:MAG: PIG-L family deacetylase [Cellulomonadaceae bacterium]|jgi:N-acetyl-1-D-myo-inositol-2-amino-2-deoxy-alpha-D-glucopyranoside deacetylase|nr:PIG-L family deacetylase [Cellulomonadaceae bacterium]
MQSLVVVHAHPDDETLWTGGLIATWAAQGWPVSVVTCTRGERGEVLALPGTTSEGMAGLEGDGPALAAWREGELAAALAALGDGISHHFLDEGLPDRYEDSGMVWVAPGLAGPDPAAPAGFAVAPLDDAASRLAGLLREAAADIVVTYEADGGYGHPDHVRAHAVTARAVQMMGDDAPACWEVLSDQDAPGDITIDVASVLDQVTAAMTAHATQIQGVRRADDADRHCGILGYYALSNNVLSPIRATETYRTARTTANIA